MQETVSKLEKYLCSVESYFINSSETSISFKSSPSKWSKKEILGHLIDSGINNYQRFTAIQFEKKPFRITPYDQDKLVLANDYQHANLYELMGLWLSINRRIIRILKLQTEKTLKYEIIVDGANNNFEFLIIDYLEHMKHHINQIID